MAHGPRSLKVLHSEQVPKQVTRPQLEEQHNESSSGGVEVSPNHRWTRAKHTIIDNEEDYRMTYRDCEHYEASRINVGGSTLRLCMSATTQVANANAPLPNLFVSINKNIEREK